MNRRDLLQTLGLGLMSAPSMAMPPSHERPSPDQTFPLFLPQSFGASADGETLDSPAINAAIDRASVTGGGIVYLRPGIYLSGTVVLKSKVTLYLEAGAVLLGSKDVSQYTPQPGPSATGDANQRHLLFARDVEDVTIAGPGVIDGQGKSFWVPTNREQMPPEEHWQDVVTRDWKPLPRVSPMIELVNCHRLRIEHIRVENSSGWTMRLINCANVVVDGIAIMNPVYGINVDGIDVTNCSDVRISNCSIDTADDAICLKSENPYGSAVPACRNITVTNCTMTGCCNGFKFGTRTEGAFENITFSNSVIYNDNVDLNARIISGICLEMVDGGSIDGVVVTGIRMQRVRTPIFLRLGNRTPRPDGSAGTFRRVMISDILADGAVMTSSITGVPSYRIEDITLSNIHVDTVEETRSEWLAAAVPEKINAYPEARMFGRLPAYGLYCRHVRGLRLRDVTFQSPVSQANPSVACDDVLDLEIRGLQSLAPAHLSSALSFRNVQNAWIREVQAPRAISALLQCSGEDSANILVSSCDLRQATRPVSMSDDFPKQALTLANNIPNTNS